MNYQRIYSELCLRGKLQRERNLQWGRWENHHIVPRHAGGGNEAANITKLQRKEHILAHRLLARIHMRTGDMIAYRLMSGTFSDLWELEPERMRDTVMANLRKVDREKQAKATSAVGKRAVLEKTGIHAEGMREVALKAYLDWCKANPDEKRTHADSMHTPEAVAKMARAKTKFFPVGPDGVVYQSLRDAALLTGHHPKSICNWTRRSHYGWSRIPAEA